MIPKGGNAVLKADPVIAATADACAVIRAERSLLAHRTHCQTTYAAKSWGETRRRVIARIEATTLGMDIRTIVTSIQGSTPERLYEFTYCDRGRAENLPPIDCKQSTAGQRIKLHKTQIKSDPDRVKTRMGFTGTGFGGTLGHVTYFRKFAIPASVVA
jgi:hypothetical protein